MSNWTHVAGVVRIDSIRIFETEPNFDDIFGKEILFDSSLNEWDKAYENPDDYMPFGSEGSLQKSVWVNSDKDCVAAYTVSIFGDLRDHDDPQDIIDWFKKKCSECAVRNAVIVVENEWNGQLVWAYREDLDND